MDGWIKLFRQFIKWEWYKDTNVKSLFIHLLLSANHKDKNWQGIIIKKGQLITSINSLSEETGLSVQNIRTALNKLKSTSEITIKTTNKYTLITIEKYTFYQCIGNDNNIEDNKEFNKQLTNEQQTTNKQLTTNNNEKNIKNDKNEKKNISKKETFDELIEKYTTNDELKEELKNHLATRKAKKATLTNRAIELSLKRLDELVKSVPVNEQEGMKLKIVRKSIERGWTGFFPIQENNRSNDGWDYIKQESQRYRNQDLPF